MLTRVVFFCQYHFHSSNSDSLKRADLLDYARGTLLRRATAHGQSIWVVLMNTMVPEKGHPKAIKVPMQQRLDSRFGDVHYFGGKSARKHGGHTAIIGYVKIKKKQTQKRSVKCF